MKINLEKIQKDKPIKELINFSILNIDKPANCTSFDVVNFIRKLFSEFGIEKCGHGGTLDPQVTGVLPIFLGNACKIQDLFMHHDKTYVGKMILHKEISEIKLKEAIKKFTGKINQLPPRKSRVKRVVREREVKSFEILDFNEKNKTAEFMCEVQAGTYIRKLIDDLGKSLGIGCQMTELRRTRAGLFSSSDKEFVKIEDVEKALEEFKTGKTECEEKLRNMLIPAEIILELIPSIEIDKKWLYKLTHGSPIFDEMLSNPDEDLKIIQTRKPFAVLVDNKLIEIAKFTDKFEQKSILAKAESVLV
jgi:H/ACA ribonucleoprotein complex subunit 4